MIPVVRAAADDQRRHFDVVEHLVLDAGNGLPGLRYESVEPAQHQFEELVAVEGKDPRLVGGVFRDALFPLIHAQKAFHSKAADRHNARHDVVGAQHERAVHAADDVPHHELGDDLGVEHRGQHRIPGAARAAGDDARPDAQPGDQRVQRLGTHVGFTLPVKLDVGFPTVGPVPEQHPVAASDKLLCQRSEAGNVLAVAAAGCECDEVPCLAEDFVDDVAAVDLDDLLRHAITSTSPPTTRTG